MNQPKVTSFNLKSFLRQRKSVSVVLNEILTNNRNKYEFLKKKTFFSKTYLRAHQKYTPNTHIDVPLSLLNYYSKRQYYLRYNIDKIQDSEASAGVQSLKLNSFYKTNYLSPAANIEVRKRTDLYDLTLKILYKKRDKNKRLCGQAIQKRIKQKTLAFLSQQKLNTYSDDPLRLIAEVLNKSFQKDLADRLLDQASFLKSILVVNVDLL